MPATSLALAHLPLSQGGLTWLRQPCWHHPPTELHGPTPPQRCNSKLRKLSHSYSTSCKLTTVARCGSGPTRGHPPPRLLRLAAARMATYCRRVGAPPVTTTALKTASPWGGDGNTKQQQPPTPPSELKSANGSTPPGAKPCSSHKQGHTPTEPSPQSPIPMTTATLATFSACFS